MLWPPRSQPPVSPPPAPTPLTGPVELKEVPSYRGAGTGGLGLAIEGPSEAKMSCKDNKDGSCAVEYIPFTAGDYDVNITFGGRPIPGGQRRRGLPEGRGTPADGREPAGKSDVQTRPQSRVAVSPAPEEGPARGAVATAGRQGGGCCWWKPPPTQTRPGPPSLARGTARTPSLCLRSRGPPALPWAAPATRAGQVCRHCGPWACGHGACFPHI